MKNPGMLTLAFILALSLLLSACGSQPAASSENNAGEPSAPAKETTSAQPDNTSPVPEQTADSSRNNESSAVPAQTSAPAEKSETTGAAPSGELAAAHKEVLVVYFSATGTTKGVAEKIAKITDADLYEIIPAEPYSSADLNYSDRNSRSTKEQNDKSARPAIGSDPIDLSGYKTIYIGFPIWWGEEPRIMDTFVESCDFTGIALIPFCTSASSGIGRSGPNMEALAGTGTWLDGRRFSGSVSESDLRSWIEGLK